MALLEGFDACYRMLEGLNYKTAPIARDALREVGLRMEGTAKELCPIDTGYLHNSIKTNARAGDGGANATQVQVVAGAEYAVYVEFGTGVLGSVSAEYHNGVSYTPGHKGNLAQPFMQPAFNQHKGEILPRIEAALREAIG